MGVVGVSVEGDIGGCTLVVRRVVIGAIIGEGAAKEAIDSGVICGGNSEAAGCLSTAGHRVDPLDYADGHWEGRPMGAMDPFSCLEAEKIIAPLAISCRT